MKLVQGKSKQGLKPREPVAAALFMEGSDTLALT
jgi:hypothetical protein